MKLLVAIVLLGLFAIVLAEPEAPQYYELLDNYPAVDVAERRGGWGGWAPKFNYLKLNIPIPRLPRIKLGFRTGFKAHASLHEPKGWW